MAITTTNRRRSSITKSKKFVSQAAKELLDLLEKQNDSDDDSLASYTKSAWSKTDKSGNYEIEQELVSAHDFHKVNLINLIIFVLSNF